MQVHTRITPWLTAYTCILENLSVKHVNLERFMLIYETYLLWS